MAGMTSLNPTQPNASGFPVSSYKYQPMPIFTICRAMMKQNLATMNFLKTGKALKTGEVNMIDGKSKAAGFYTRTHF
jgi:hypothetical protein